MTILELIKSSGPVSRAELMEKTGDSDRIVRKKIEHLKKAGALIVNTGGGYVLIDPADPVHMELLHSYYKRQRAAAISALASLSKIRKVLKENGKL